MEKLSKLLFNKCSHFMIEDARPLERYLFENHFVRPCEKDIIRSLGNYQNKDGGFGHGIESDFVLPNSSPMATSVGLRYLSKLDHHEEAMDMIKHAIEYLETAYIPSRKGWLTVPEDVNDYAHAPWWTYDKKTGMTVIDGSWGNPSAELIGYVYKYRQYTSTLDAEDLVKTAMGYFNDLTSFQSFHEVYCYIDLYETLPEHYSKQVYEKLTEAVQQLVCLEPEEWHTYVAKPLDFIRHADELFGLDMEVIHKNLDYVVEQISESGIVMPNWTWGDAYGAQWEFALEEWKGLLTLKGLLALDAFDRIQKM